MQREENVSQDSSEAKGKSSERKRTEVDQIEHLVVDLFGSEIVSLPVRVVATSDLFSRSREDSSSRGGSCRS